MQRCLFTSTSPRGDIHSRSCRTYEQVVGSQRLLGGDRPKWGIASRRLRSLGFVLQAKIFQIADTLITGTSPNRFKYAGFEPSVSSITLGWLLQ